jgi:hypothetical protein
MGPSIFRHPFSLLHITASAKCVITGTGQNNAPESLMIANKVCPHIEQFDTHIRVAGVASLGPVEGDDNNTIVAPLDQERRIVI